MPEVLNPASSLFKDSKELDSGSTNYRNDELLVNHYLTFIFTGGIRVFIRLLLAESESIQLLIHNPFKAGARRSRRKRLLILGAGNTHRILITKIGADPVISTGNVR